MTKRKSHQARRVSCTTAALALCVAGSIALNPEWTLAAPPIKIRVSIPRDTPVSLRLEQELSSADARVGEPVHLTLAADLFIGGQTIAKTGLACQSTITYTRAKSADEEGSIRYAEPVCDLGHGQQIRLAQNESGVRRDDAEMVGGFLAVIVLTSPVTLPMLLIKNVKEARRHAHRPSSKWIPRDQVDRKGEVCKRYVRRIVRVRLDRLLPSEPTVSAP